MDRSACIRAIRGCRSPSGGGPALPLVRVLRPLEHVHRALEGVADGAPVLVPVAVRVAAAPVALQLRLALRPAAAGARPRALPAVAEARLVVLVAAVRREAVERRVVLAEPVGAERRRAAADAV